MALKSTRAKKTKVEVEQEFNQLTEAVERMQNLDSSKSDMIEQIREGEVRAAVSEITVEVISKKVSELNLEISRALSGLSEKMLQEVQLLGSLKDAVAIESKEIQRLHGIDVAATGVDQMLVDFRQKKMNCTMELEQLSQELTRQQEKREQEETEYNQQLTKSRAREKEEYEYKKNVERKKWQDQFEEESRVRERQNREMQEQLEKNWKEMEASFKLREEEFSALKRETEQFPTRLASECAKSVKEAVKDAESRYAQDIERLKRDLVIEKQMSELKIKQFQELLTAAHAQVGTLQSQLDEAKRQVQDIAVKAIEGASGAKALNHINQIAIEQAKNRTQP
ncbi:MAG TPA: hypothetical protein VGJ00_02190 [Rhabdochlamydiaceae bacterium]|jgi:hypothetical protein